MGQLEKLTGSEPGMFEPCTCCGLPPMQLAFDLSGQPRKYDSETATTIHAAIAAVASTAQRAQEAQLGLAAEESKLAKAKVEFLAQAEKVRNLRRERDELAAMAAHAREAIHVASAAGAAGTDDKKPGGFWYCPGGCSHCFHKACHAEHPDLRDGANKVCVPCHVTAQSRGRGARNAAAWQR